MEDIVAFVSDDENLTTVVAGVAVVGATIVGGLDSGATSRRRRKRLSANAERNASHCAPLSFFRSDGPAGLAHTVTAHGTRHTELPTYALLLPRGAAGM